MNWLCPSLTIYTCTPYPDADDESFPPLISFALSDFANSDVTRIFQKELIDAVSLGKAQGKEIYVADFVFWEALRRAEKECKKSGNTVQRLSYPFL